jgi:hypothetical protein
MSFKKRFHKRRFIGKGMTKNNLLSVVVSFIFARLDSFFVLKAGEDMPNGYGRARLGFGRFSNDL